jgi:predicted nucleic acid-binding protein
VTLVVDASVAVEALTSGRLGPLEGEDVVGPPLLWSEVRSVLHVARWRGVLTDADAMAALEDLDSGTFRERRHRRLGREAWRISDELGWAKIYDAEYLALAFLVGAPLATLDRRLLRAAERLGIATRTFA